MHTNIHIWAFQKEKRGKGAESLFEGIMAENFPNVGKEIDIQVQEAHRVSNRINPWIPT